MEEEEEETAGPRGAGGAHEEGSCAEQRQADRQTARERTQTGGHPAEVEEEASGNRL